jgi:hypothetical protein
MSGDKKRRLIIYLDSQMRLKHDRPILKRNLFYPNPYILLSSIRCYAGRVVGCSQGSSADAIRYPRGMEQSVLHKTAARIVEFMHRFSTHL